MIPTLRQTFHYAAAVTRHLATGAHIRTDEEVSRLLHICQTCEHYVPSTPTSGHCHLCGCRCSTKRSSLTNKIRMSSEHCPAGRW